MPISLDEAKRLAEVAERAQIAASLLAASLGVKEIGATVEFAGIDAGRRIRVDDAVARDILERNALAEIDKARQAGLDVAELEAMLLAAVQGG